MGWIKEKMEKGEGGDSKVRGKSRFWFRLIPVIIILLLFVVIGIAIANYQFMDFFNVSTAQGPPGTIFTETLVRTADELTQDWMPNDKIWPTVLLDNPQNFQLGVLESVRYTTRVLRDKLSRMRTTDKIDPDADAAFVFLSNDPFKWILPSAESKFHNGVTSLKAYEARLATGDADFYSRADNLNELLDQYVSLLGGVNTRLSNAPRHKTVVTSEETAGDQYTRGEKKIDVAVPWTKIDDNFYFARGVAFGIRQMMLAIRYDFANILEVKRAEELVDRIIEVLNESQFEPWFILNGNRGSIWANHSLHLQSLLEDARQKMRSLQDMIRE